jgi:hypothetical protein
MSEQHQIEFIEALANDYERAGNELKANFRDQFWRRVFVLVSSSVNEARINLLATQLSQILTIGPSERIASPLRENIGLVDPSVRLFLVERQPRVDRRGVLTSEHRRLERVARYLLVINTVVSILGEEVGLDLSRHEWGLYKSKCLPLRDRLTHPNESVVIGDEELSDYVRGLAYVSQALSRALRRLTDALDAATARE